ncbi:unnamed protein product [Protopolystoma xenopodis]|uniref:Uncharacterized protein n=1 Tax=Protopolystoma xenopodis TaxID=117903 RepID=A0A448WCS4_9PLAT|nr:unnamed protein product [Protopolystoma xenopodis]
MRPALIVPEGLVHESPVQTPRSEGGTTKTDLAIQVVFKNVELSHLRSLLRFFHKAFTSREDGSLNLVSASSTPPAGVEPGSEGRQEV